MATPDTPVAAPHAILAQPALDSTAEGINPASIHRLLAIAAAGAIGGFLFWLLASLTGTSPLPVNAGPWAVPALMFLGAFAAAIGVYVLTASNTSALKTYIFAALCGVCWQPVIASGVRMVANANAVSQTTQLGSQTQAVQQAAASGDKQQVTAAVQQIVPLTTQVLNSATVVDPGNREGVLDFSKKAIAQVQSAADKAPEASAEALQNIAVTAANNGTPSVALHAVQSLEAIGLQASRDQKPAVVQAVQQSLTNIIAQSKDPSIQTAARNAAAQLNP